MPNEKKIKKDHALINKNFATFTLKILKIFPVQVPYPKNREFKCLLRPFEVDKLSKREVGIVHPADH